MILNRPPLACATELSLLVRHARMGGSRPPDEGIGATPRRFSPRTGDRTLIPVTVSRSPSCQPSTSSASASRFPQPHRRRSRGHALRIRVPVTRARSFNPPWPSRKRQHEAGDEATRTSKGIVLESVRAPILTSLLEICAAHCKYLRRACEAPANHGASTESKLVQKRCIMPGRTYHGTNSPYTLRRPAPIPRRSRRSQRRGDPRPD